MPFSLRTKVFMPLLILMAMLIGYLYWYWMPQSLATMERQYREAVGRHLDSVVEGVIPLLLGRELDILYENFDALQKKNSDWLSISLTDAAGRPIYPLENSSAPVSRTYANKVSTLTKPIDYLGTNLGKMTVVVDLEPHLKELRQELHNAVSVMLIVIAVIVLSIGIVLERKVIWPVNTLGKAAQNLAKGEFDPLLMKAGDDEVGDLVNSFKTMRENLASSYTLLRQGRDKYSTLYNQTPVLLHSVDGSDTIIEVNDFWLTKLGYRREEVLGKKATDFFTEESRKYAAEVVLPAFLRDGFCKEIPYQFVKKNGELEDVLLSATAERDENGNISRSFAVIEDVTDRKKIENRLMLSEQKNRAITTTANDAIIMMDENGNISFWNPAAENIFGYSGEEVLGRELHGIIGPERSREDFLMGMEGFRNTDSGNTLGKTLEITAIKKDGTEFPVELSLSAFQMMGRWHAVGIVRDITQRKLSEKRVLQSLEEKELLLQEIHHRVKNNMQVITSLLDLQLGYIADRQPEEIFSDIKNRIRSMSLVHEKLYHSRDLSQVDFKDYVTSLIGNLYKFYDVSLGRINLRLDIEDIFFGIDTAIPCGLIVNELITNSLKYAFPDGREGEVELRLNKTGEGEKGEGIYSLVIRDNGIGIPAGIDMRGVKTLGLYLVTTLVEHQLQGTVDLDRTNGTEFRIIFKVLKHKKRI